uniref:Uncharacterized protein n=1 Tax=Anopheles minimus TaxID=112268 RepID=A0A182WPY0_9DIPT
MEELLGIGAYNHVNKPMFTHQWIEIRVRECVPMFLKVCLFRGLCASK